jgi:lipoprotein-anchoring transpeptidase ErfK/SrfK
MNATARLVAVRRGMLGMDDWTIDLTGPFLGRRAVLMAGLGLCATLGCGMMSPGFAKPVPAKVKGDMDDPYKLPRANYSKFAPEFRRAEIGYAGRHRPGTIIVDTAARQLWYVMEGKRAIRYGCAVGRDGFRWAGVADIGRKVMWPKWTPPKEMIERSPEKAKWKNGMPGGPENPLGARALYLYQNGNDTLFRIHGTNEPGSIGKKASSGCIRMLNQDIVDLFSRAPIGTRVLVLAEGVGAHEREAFGFESGRRAVAGGLRGRQRPAGRVGSHPRARSCRRYRGRARA